jgi:pimeloyl-ACP methyl ester carboxylesterase
MKTTKIFFRTTDDIKLAAILHLPSKQTDKIIILAHGITVDKDEDGTFPTLANLLANSGYAVLRFDFRGHGESEGKSIDMTLTGELLDLEAAVKMAKVSEYKNIGLLGASFGGGEAVLYATKYQDQLKALCLWNPVLNYDHTFINPYLPWIVKRKGHMRNDLQEKGWTTLGSHNFIIGKTLFDEMEQTYPFEELKKITIPTIIIHGNKDTYVPYEDSRNYVGNLQHGELIAIEGGEHGFHDSGEYAEQANQATLNFFKKYL